MDFWTKDKRSSVMSKIRSKNTRPELILRSALHRQGYRFRIHAKNLPGKPDIILPKYKTIIFVHGCFWHFHKECPEGRIPDTNSSFWEEKLSRTMERDVKHQKYFIDLGWKVLVIWECEIEKKLDDVLKNINRVLLRLPEL
jgi:DNA mismatch endonuclease (patch repair protein)